MGLLSSSWLVPGVARAVCCFGPLAFALQTYLDVPTSLLCASPMLWALSCPPWAACGLAQVWGYRPYHPRATSLAQGSGFPAALTPCLALGSWEPPGLPMSDCITCSIPSVAGLALSPEVAPNTPQPLNCLRPQASWGFGAYPVWGGPEGTNRA